MKKGRAAGAEGAFRSGGQHRRAPLEESTLGGVGEMTRRDDVNKQSGERAAGDDGELLRRAGS